MSSTKSNVFVNFNCPTSVKNEWISLFTSKQLEQEGHSLSSFTVKKESQYQHPSLTTAGCHLTTKEGISGSTSFFKKIALWLMIITNSKMISNLSSDKICKQNFNEDFRLDNYKLWSELSMAHLIPWPWDVLSRGLWSLEDARAPDRQTDTLFPAIFSPGFTDLTFHKPLPVPPEIKKQMLPFTESGTAHLCWVRRCPRTRLDTQLPKTCNFFALTTSVLRSKWVVKVFLVTKFMKITYSPFLDLHRLHFWQVGFAGFLSVFFHEAHQDLPFHHIFHINSGS